MKTYVQPGEKFDFVVAGTPVVSGQGLLTGSIFGIVQNSAAVGERSVLQLEGVVDMAKAPSQAWIVGAPIYWDNTAKVATNVVGSNTKIGVAWAAVGAGANETVGRVRLNGAF